MARDPAFLFYPGDWLGGTMTFSRHHKGAYMDCLMAQFNSGHLSIDDIKFVLGVDFDSMWESKLKAKFKVDAAGNFFNEKLDNEIIKRKNFVKSRQDNLDSTNKKKPSHMQYHKEHHMHSHMENENENENTSDDEIENRKLKFFLSMSLFKEKYDEETLKEFCEYWTEHNENGKKMRFEKEKVFDKTRRLATWIKNKNKYNGTYQQPFNRTGGKLGTSAARIAALKKW